MVCFIHRPEYYKLYSDEKTGSDLRGLGQIIVAKHRNGATDDVWLRFRGKYAKFQNKDEETDDMPEIDEPNSGASIQIRSSMGSPTMSPAGATQGIDAPPF